MTAGTRKRIVPETPVGNSGAPDADVQMARAEKERRWRVENADAIHAENDYIEKHGLPLDRYRLF